MSQDRELPDEIQPVQPMPPQHSGEVYDDLQFEQKGPADRLINWAAGLPWWAIILAVVAIAVIYSMFTSAAYQDVLRALTDNPQVSTDDLFDWSRSVGERRWWSVATWASRRIGLNRPHGCWTT